MDKTPKGWWNIKEHCKLVAQKCSTHQELRKKYPAMIRAARRKGWYNDITAHMPPIIKSVTKEECLKTALQYTNRGEFRNGSPKEYGASCKHGWLDEVCSHMSGNIKRRAGYWDNIEHCKQTALLFNSCEQLKRSEKGCYDSIIRHGWTKECFAHMNIRVKKYTFKQLKDIANKYKTFAEFRKNDIGAYEGARTRGILEEICQHMPSLRKYKKSNVVLNFETCKAAALKYKTRAEFQNSEDCRFYGFARRHKFLDDICSHMTKIGNKKLRCIYVAKFLEDKSAYIGLTYNTNVRWSDHLRDENSSINKHIQETGINPVFEKLTDYINEKEASIQEGIFVDKFAKAGWNILNVAKTGSLGHLEGYTKEQVLAEAEKYNSLRDFRKYAPGFYQAGYRSQEYWAEVRAICKPHARIFTDEELYEIAKGCNSLEEFRKKDHAALDAAQKRGILEEICHHMEFTAPSKHKWSDDEIYEASLQCSTRVEFQNRFNSQYQAARYRGRLDEFCMHMKQAHTEWTFDLLQAEAKKYQYKSDFQKKSKSAYASALKKGILSDICQHMIPKKRTKYKCDTLDDAKQLASTCKGRNELRHKYIVAYKMLSKAGLLDFVLPIISKKHNYKWTKEKRKEAALQCHSRAEFKKRFPQAFEVARINKELHELCAHMDFYRHIWTIEEITEICSHCSSFSELKTYCPELWLHATKKSKERRDLIKSLCNKGQNKL